MKYLLPLCLALAATTAQADPPEIVKVVAVPQEDGWRFDVTLRHGDTGWDDYADGWRVLDMNGKELGQRVLYHPHVEEQPFTRSLSGVEIPAGVREVLVEARDSVGGWSGAIQTVRLP